MVRLFRSVRALGYLVPVWFLLSPASAWAQGTIMGNQFCCSSTSFCISRPPKIKFKRVCPKPVCNPCELENYGYYPTCWTPWLKEVNYSHCSVPPPGAMLPPSQASETTPEEEKPEQLRQPPTLGKPKPDKEGTPEPR